MLLNTKGEQRQFQERNWAHRSSSSSRDRPSDFLKEDLGHGAIGPDKRALQAQEACHGHRGHHFQTAVMPPAQPLQARAVHEYLLSPIGVMQQQLVIEAQIQNFAVL